MKHLPEKIAQDKAVQVTKSKLVSIVIPCFNTEPWLNEAIDSCLSQSYPSIEIIVIDDGSTDGSLDIIKSYSDRIIWETGPNQGGNHARNRGFALSKGDYVQFLDADDYLLPQKLEKQVQFLKTTGADVVYGDWRHQYHLKDGEVTLDDIKTSRKSTRHSEITTIRLVGFPSLPTLSSVSSRVIRRLG